MKTSVRPLAFLIAACLMGVWSPRLKSEDLQVAVSHAEDSLKSKILSHDWGQCEGRFHYTFLVNGEFSIDGTLLCGKWEVRGNDLVLQWSGSAIIDNLRFDQENRRLRHAKGEKFDILPGAVATAGGDPWKIVAKTN